MQPFKDFPSDHFSTDRSTVCDCRQFRVHRSISRACSGPFDCTASSCGNFKWWVALDSAAKTFVQTGTDDSTYANCTDGTLITATNLTPLICKCPTYAQDILLCVCGPTIDSATTLTVSCRNQTAGDEKMAKVISNIPASTLVDWMDLSGNLLSRVPANLTQYTTLISLSLASNAITSIASSDLTLPGNVTVLDVSNNLISNIATNSLPGKKELKYSLISYHF